MAIPRRDGMREYSYLPNKMRARSLHPAAALGHLSLVLLSLSQGKTTAFWLSAQKVVVPQLLRKKLKFLHGASPALAVLAIEGGVLRYALPANWTPTSGKKHFVPDLLSLRSANVPRPVGKHPN